MIAKCYIVFYYYEKEGEILASDRGDLPWPKAEPAPGAPIWYLIEGDPVLGRGSFRVSHPGQLRPPTGWRCWTPPACLMSLWTPPCPPPWRRGGSPR